MSKPVFCLLGPTASGKTALACTLVQRFPCEIISVDSAMIYRGMDIGTAKPSAAELQHAPHHLIDIINPPEIYSAAKFTADAKALIEKIFAAGKYPLLVGGTMMYFNALQNGLNDLPEADQKVREELLARAQTAGWPALHRELQSIDPKTADRIHGHDAQRIQRALEIYFTTGKPLSYFLAQENKKPPFAFINFALFPKDRSWLHKRIEQRLQEMVSKGFIAEVEQLLQAWSLAENSPAMRCVGYRQAYQYLAGEYQYQDFFPKALAATRQLAKRQLTWLRHWPEIHYIDSQDDAEQQKIIDMMQKILDNR